MSDKSNSNSTTNVRIHRAASRVIFSPIRYRCISSLSLRDNSPRHYDEDQVFETMQLIETFGFLAAVSVDLFGTIIVGELLVEAAKRLGLSQVPATVLRLEAHQPFADNCLAKVSAKAHGRLLIERDAISEPEETRTGTGYVKTAQLDRTSSSKRRKTKR